MTCMPDFQKNNMPQICNALGPQAGKHKISVFYIRFPSLPQYMNTSNASIFLYAIAKSIHVKEFGSSAILEQFKSEILELQDTGFTLNDGSVLRLGLGLVQISQNNFQFLVNVKNPQLSSFLYRKKFQIFFSRLFIQKKFP
jgi:hypothetical protein